MPLSYICYLFMTFLYGNVYALDNSIVYQLIRNWAPIIWLAPDEKYFPSNAEEFLNNVYPIKDESEINNNLIVKENITIPLGIGSQNYYLVPKNKIDIDNEDSFLRGKNPTKERVFVYATVSECSTSDLKLTPRKRTKILKANERQLHFQVTYWTFYPYNEGKEVCFIGKFPAPFIFNTCIGHRKTVGNHVGDWEHMTLFFRGNTFPEEIFLAVHDAGVYYRLDPNTNLYKYKTQITRKGIVQRPKFPSVVNFSEGRIVLFAARGSHGLWSEPGEHYYVRVPRLSDKNGYGIMWKTWENMMVYDVNNPPDWMKFRGKWGNPKSKCYCFLFKKLGLCELWDGPVGILMRKKDFTC